MLDATVDSNWILLFTRIVIGLVMVRYGWPKIKDLKENAEDFVKMGFKPGWFWGTPFAIVECFGGIALLLGIVPQVVVALFAFMMIVGTFWKMKVKKGFGGVSYDLALLAMCLVVLFFGPGFYVISSYSLPSVQWYMLLIALGAGLVMAFLPEILGERYRKWDGK